MIHHLNEYTLKNKVFDKKNFMAPFCGRGSTASRLQICYKEADYFLPIIFQKFLVLI